MAYILLSWKGITCNKFKGNSVNILSCSLIQVLKEFINQIAYLINYSQNTCHCGLFDKNKVFSSSSYENKSYAYDIGKSVIKG